MMNRPACRDLARVITGTVGDMKKRTILLVMGAAGALIAAVLVALAWLAGASQQEALAADG
jgi:hypothetical protein